VAAMRQDLLRGNYLQADETIVPVQIQDKQIHDKRSGSSGRKHGSSAPTASSQGESLPRERSIETKIRVTASRPLASPGAWQASRSRHGRSQISEDHQALRPQKETS
jgi:hypothetical protein